jgi:hypothetical protein
MAITRQDCFARLSLVFEPFSCQLLGFGSRDTR